MSSQYSVYIGPSVFVQKGSITRSEEVMACEKCGDQCNTKFCALCGGRMKPTTIQVKDSRSVWCILNDAGDPGFDDEFSVKYGDYIVPNLHNENSYMVLDGGDVGFNPIPILDPIAVKRIFQKVTEYLDACGIKWEYKFGAISEWF